MREGKEENGVNDNGNNSKNPSVSRGLSRAGSFRKNQGSLKKIGSRRHRRSSTGGDENFRGSGSLEAIIDFGSEEFISAISPKGSSSAGGVSSKGDMGGGGGSDNSYCTGSPNSCAAVSDFVITT